MKSKWGFYGGGIGYNYSLKKLLEDGYKIINLYIIYLERSSTIVPSVEFSSERDPFNIDLVMLNKKSMFK